MKRIKLKNEDAMLDRIGLTIYDFGYFTLNKSEYISLREIIGEKLFRTSKHFPKNSKYSSILQKDIEGTGYLKYFPNKQRCTLSIKLFINPTRLLNHELLSKNQTKTKRSLDGKDNFIPYNTQLTYSQKTLKYRSIELLVEKIQSIIEEFTNCFEANIISYSNSFFPKVSFSVIEIYWDKYCQTPFPYLESVTQSWMKYFKETKSPQITDPSLSEGLEKSAKYLIGINRTNERFKLYTKTPKLIRHEAEFRKGRIYSIRKTTVLEMLSIESIIKFIEPLVSHALTVFNKVKPDASSIHEEPTTFRPIYNIARVCGMDAELFDLILSEVRYNRRLVSRPIYYPRTRKLLNTGEWKSPSRGIYIPNSKVLSLIDRLYRLLKN